LPLSFASAASNCHRKQSTRKAMTTNSVCICLEVRLLSIQKISSIINGSAGAKNALGTTDTLARLTPIFS